MYFGESQQPHSQRPDVQKEQLAEQNALLKKLLRQQAEGAQKAHTKPATGFFRRTLRLVMFAAILIVVLGGAFTFHTLTAPKKLRITDSSIFPSSTIQQIRGFKFYYFQSSFQTDFALQRNSISLRAGVLVFQMKNPAGQTLAFTEEATPPGYDTSLLQADKQFTGRYGQEFITDAPLRTTGALFTVDNTWILINAPKPIGADLMQQILDALQPASH